MGAAAVVANGTVHRYRVFGASLVSRVAIPGLFAFDGDDAPFDVRFEAIVAPMPEQSEALRQDGCDIVFADGTRALVDAVQRTVTVHARDGASLEDTATYVTGPVAGLLGRLRGLTCLHAAVVVIGGGAHALLGASESGKSTTAAAFAREGFTLLSDDVCAIERRGESLLAHPGSPRIRLWPEGAEMALGAGHGLPAITPTWEKRYVDLVETRRYEPAPRPLAAIWIFRDGIDRVDTLSGASCLTSALEHVYLPAYATPDIRRRDFETIAALCASAPVRLLPWSFDPAARVRAVLAHRDDGGGS